MGWPVVTVASGGMPVTDVTATTGRGTPVSEAASKFGRAVTKVASGGMAVVFETIGIAPPVVPMTTWNAADTLAVNLSNGNLTATSTNTAGVRAVKGYSSGKYYFEELISTWGSSANGPGLATAAAPLTGGVISAGKLAVAASNGTIWVNNGSSPYTLGARASGNIIGIAVDLSTGLAWMRVAPSGSWNAVSGSANDPATGVGGINVAPMGLPLFPGFWTTSIGDVVTANFGASAFSGAVPSGFTAGWPA